MKVRVRIGKKRRNLLKRMQSGGIVALKPGQHFDPLGDAKRLLERLKKEELEL